VLFSIVLKLGLTEFETMNQPVMLPAGLPNELIGKRLGEVSNGHVEGFPRFVKLFLTSVLFLKNLQRTPCAEFFKFFFFPFKNSQISRLYISKIEILPSLRL
jgi:hypothetical protein